jgi:hypothetical protein
MPGRYYGWVKDKKNPPVMHQYKAIKVPDIIDLSMYKPNVFDQGTVGRCTGCGIGGKLSGQIAQLGGNPSHQQIISPDDLYNMARKKEGDLGQDNGAEPGDVYLMVQQYGAVPLDKWPMTPTLDTEDPLSPTRLAEAIKYPDFTPVGVDTSNPDTVIQNILDAMAQVVNGVTGMFISTGFPWFASWENYDGGPLPNQSASGAIAGGHETFWFYANVPNRYFYGQNSWDITWGSKNDFPGCYIMPFDQVKVLSQLGMDVRYALFTLPGPQPAPTPTPPAPPTPMPPPPAPKKCCSFFDLLHQRRASL